MDRMSSIANSQIRASLKLWYFTLFEKNNRSFQRVCNGQPAELHLPGKYQYLDH